MTQEAIILILHKQLANLNADMQFISEHLNGTTEKYFTVGNRHCLSLQDWASGYYKKLEGTWHLDSCVECRDIYNQHFNKELV